MRRPHVPPPEEMNRDAFAALVARVADSQDRAAFTQLFDHFAPRLIAYLVRTGSDRALAEEITQDVMATLWRKAGLFDPAKSSLSTWLYRIARNRRIDLSRRDRAATLDVADPMLMPDAPPSLATTMDAQRRDEGVQTALTRLPTEQFALIRMAFFDGLSHSQIAEVTDLPLGTVKSRIRLAFTRLRREFKALGLDAGALEEE